MPLCLDFGGDYMTTKREIITKIKNHILVCTNVTLL